MNVKKTTPPYKLGLLGIIPLVGFLVGLALTLYGIFRYKDRKLTAIGITCMLFTVLVYSALNYVTFHTDIGKVNKEKMAQTRLNSLVGDIEYYKSQNGKYPDSLPQVKSETEQILILDPTSKISVHNFNYVNLGENYLLFSCGSDEIDNTSDDIYPQIKNLKNVGWVIKTDSARIPSRGN
jgi:type II secretory pathway pseudopilin PulG